MTRSGVPWTWKESAMPVLHPRHRIVCAVLMVLLAVSTCGGRPALAQARPAVLDRVVAIATTACVGLALLDDGTGEGWHGRPSAGRGDRANRLRWAGTAR